MLSSSAPVGRRGEGQDRRLVVGAADIVVRFQGGHNAGHTLVINGETYKLALLPSGVLRPSKLSVIGNGVVFDPQAFLDEVAKLQKQGVAVGPDNLRVAENVTLILPLHRELDSIRENASKATAIGPPNAASALPMRTRSGAAPSPDGPRRSADHAAQDRAAAGTSQRDPPRTEPEGNHGAKS